MAVSGKIICEEAYAQGKMLDHSGWGGVLSRNRTPSDTDMVIDGCDEGRIAKMELKGGCDSFSLKDLSYGQRTLIQNDVKAGKGKIVYFLCPHRTPTEEKIDTFELKTCAVCYLDDNGNFYECEYPVPQLLRDRIKAMNKSRYDNPL